MIDAYLHQLQAVAALPDEHRQLPLTVMGARRGAQYEPGKSTLYVGRAVNGWLTAIDANLLTDPEALRTVVERELRGARPEREPLRWVSERWQSKEGYNTARSAFWRTIRRLEEPDDHWPAKLAWSNLYKVAPHARGNPSTRIRRACLDGAVDLLHEEITTWRPRAVVFLTGHGWCAPFLDRLASDTQTRVGGFAEARGTIDGVPFVVAPHPQGKNERALARDVVAALAR